MLLNKIKTTYSEAIISCCNERCKLYFDEKKNRVMLKGELLVQNRPEKICDCIIFQDDKTISMVELKSKLLNVNKIIAKFENSGKQSACIINSFTHDDDFRMYFILLAKSYKNFIAHEILGKKRININGKKHPIFLGKCKCSLEGIIRKASKRR